VKFKWTASRRKKPARPSRLTRASKLPAGSRGSQVEVEQKLEGALGDFAIDPAGCTCLDIGASNGGFTDCLLQHGAARVYALDVNIDQLDWKLTKNARVIPIKRNARELRSHDLPEPVGLVVIDVSFISVRKVLAPAVDVAKPGAVFLILIKPQFELPAKTSAPAES